MSKPYLYLNVRQDFIEGDRDALVTLRSAINEALRKGRAEADFSDAQADDFNLVVRHTGD